MLEIPSGLEDRGKIGVEATEIKPQVCQNRRGRLHTPVNTWISEAVAGTL